MTIEEAASAQLVPFLNDIIDTFVKAFQLYKVKNLRILFDTLNCLAWGVGPELNKPQYVQALMMPVMQYFETLSDADILTLPLFECLSTLLQTFGKAIVSVLPKIVMRCMRIVNDTAAAAHRWEQNPNEYERPDHELMAASCDLLSGLLEGLLEQSREVINQLNFYSVLALALRDSSSRVKQSGYWLLGTCATHCVEPLVPLLPELLPLCAAGLGPKMSITVSNNACWAIGEVSAKGPAEAMTPHLDAIVHALMAIIQRRDGAEIKWWQRQGHHALMQTVCVTIQRLRERTALGAQWPAIYGQLPADLRGSLQQRYGLTL